MTSTGDDYAELGRIIKRRREYLGLTPDKIHARGGPSPVTVRNMESGEAKRRRLETTYTLEQLLGWSAGAINGFLDYGTIPHEVRNPQPETEPDLAGVDTAALLEELRRRGALPEQ